MRRSVPLVFALSIAAAACSTMSDGPSARALIQPTTAASSVAGTITFRELADGAVQVEANLTGVPQGQRGFHVHERGDCGDSGNAAGGHFNPTGSTHGAPESAAHHAGDFGNLTATSAGEATGRFTTRAISLREGPNSVIGRAVIVHAGSDDLTTQPTGNAGARIGCGVVELMVQP